MASHPPHEALTPSRFVTVEQYRRCADTLERALAILANANVRVPRSGRLVTELSALRAASSGSLPSNKRDQVLLANAVLDSAVEFTRFSGQVTACESSRMCGVTFVADG
jgi:hypothetical protein